MEARRSMCRQSAGADVRSLLYPVSNEREALKRQGVRPKNHHVSNMKVIQELQQQRVQQQAERPATAPDPFKMAKFRDVESQVARRLRDGGGSASRPTSAGGGEFMRRGEGQRKAEERAHSRQEAAREVARTKTKPAIPTREQCKTAERALMTQRQSVMTPNHIKRNALEAIRGTPFAAVDGNRPPTSRPSTAPQQQQQQQQRHESFGRVPGYLLRRKEESMQALAARNERLVLHPTDCPPGMRMLREEEIAATRNELEQARLKLLKALSQLPFVIDTPSLKGKKAALEEKLQQVDRATTIYSRKRIFVAE